MMLMGFTVVRQDSEDLKSAARLEAEKTICNRKWYLIVLLKI